MINCIQYVLKLEHKHPRCVCVCIYSGQSCFSACSVRKHSHSWDILARFNHLCQQIFMNNNKLVQTTTFSGFASTVAYSIKLLLLLARSLIFTCWLPYLSISPLRAFVCITFPCILSNFLQYT